LGVERPILHTCHHEMAEATAFVTELAALLEADPFGLALSHERFEQVVRDLDAAFGEVRIGQVPPAFGLAPRTGLFARAVAARSVPIVRIGVRRLGVVRCGLEVSGKLVELLHELREFELKARRVDPFGRGDEHPPLAQRELLFELLVGLPQPRVLALERFLLGLRFGQLSVSF
jgi:hypothetical protein